MKRTIIILSCLIVSIAGLGVGSLSAQETKPHYNTPAAFEAFKQRSLWMNSSNAAGAFLDMPIQYTEMEIGYEWTRGDFSRMQQGVDENSLKINVEGSAVLTNIYAWGRFSYDRDRIKDVMYNTSIIDPYRGMPYYLAGLNPSEWKNQHYNLEFRVASRKLWNTVSFGIDGKYRASSAAKQRDLRTDNDFLYLEVTPGAVFHLNESHNLGLNFKYFSQKEDARLSSIVSDKSQIYYEMLGLGTAIENKGDSYVSNYVGNNVGGAIQYGYSSSTIELLISGGYDYKVEDLEVSFTRPRKRGSVRDHIWRGDFTLYTKGVKMQNHFKLGYINRSIDGIEHFTKMDEDREHEVLYSGVRAKYKRENISFNYTLLRNRMDEYSWLVGAEVNYEKVDDSYLLPKSVFKVERLTFGLSGKKNFKVSNKLDKRLLIGAAAKWTSALSGKYDYNGAFADSPTVTDLTQSDFNYLYSDFGLLQFSAIYSQKVKEDVRANLFLKLNFDYAKTNKFNYDHRSIFYLSLGCNF